MLAASALGIALDAERPDRIKMKIDYQGFVVEIRTGDSPWRRNSYYYAARADAERHAARQRLFGREARVVETNRPADVRAFAPVRPPQGR
jgi:hypothetical protein